MFLIWTMLIIGPLLLDEISSCEITPLQDIQDSVRLSNLIYVQDFQSGSAIPGSTEYPGLPGYTVQSQIEESIRGEPLKAVIAKKVDPLGNTTIVCFQGTETPRQLLQQARSATTQPWQNVIIGGKKMKLMKYYWDAVKILHVENIVEIRNDTKYIFTGHSLGGALASVFALAMTQIHDGDMWKDPGSRLITFGQPRIGDLSFANAHDDLIPPFKKLRVVYNKDIVPNVPRRRDDFVHTSTEIWINRQVHHKVHTRICQGMWIKYPCISYAHYYTEEWKVCPERDGGDKCSYGKKSIHGVDVGVRVFSGKDHRKESYAKAVEYLIQDEGKTKQFEGELCKLSKEEKEEKQEK